MQKTGHEKEAVSKVKNLTAKGNRIEPQSTKIQNNNFACGKMTFDTTS